ncbi:MAG: hypothetical protein ABJM43_04890 [Paracoccaceae bacterium]
MAKTTYAHKYANPGQLNHKFLHKIQHLPHLTRVKRTKPLAKTQNAPFDTLARSLRRIDGAHLGQIG